MSAKALGMKKLVAKGTVLHATTLITGRAHAAAAEWYLASFAVPIKSTVFEHNNNYKLFSLFVLVFLFCKTHTKSANKIHKNC